MPLASCSFTESSVAIPDSRPFNKKRSSRNNEHSFFDECFVLEAGARGSQQPSVSGNHFWLETFKKSRNFQHFECLYNRRRRYASVSGPALKAALSPDSKDLQFENEPWEVSALRRLNMRATGLRVRQKRGEHKRISWSNRAFQSRLDTWSRCGRHLLAGALSAVFSRTCVAPLERVRMDIMLKNSDLGAAGTALSVWKREGIAGFWKGNGINVIRTAPFKAINFFSYDMYSKALLRISGGEGDGKLERFCAGAMAGVTAVLTCFPLDTIRTRLLASSGSNYAGIVDCARQMVRQEGAGSLYRGCYTAVMSIAPGSAVFYGVYDLLKQGHLKRMRLEHGSDKQVQLGVAQTLYFGALSGICAEAVVYPLEVIRRQMQLQRAVVPVCTAGGAIMSKATVSNSLKEFSTISSSIFRKNGIGGFYSGVFVNTLQVLPNAALSYFAYESLKQLLKVEVQNNGDEK